MSKQIKKRQIVYIFIVLPQTINVVSYLETVLYLSIQQVQVHFRSYLYSSKSQKSPDDSGQSEW